MEQYIVDMGKRIKSRRESLKIKQYELAEMLNISNNHMSSIERAKENPSIELLIKICNALKVTPDYLLLGTMHSNNTSQNIMDGLRLCKEEDIELVLNIVNIMVARNNKNWNDDNYIS